MPRIKTTLTVNIALYGLLTYLCLMLGLIFTKFVLDARKPRAAAPPSAAAQEK